MISGSANQIMDNKYFLKIAIGIIKMVSGIIIGSICGVVSIPVVAGVGVFVGSFSLGERDLILHILAEIIFVSIIALAAFGLLFVNIGGVVGAINVATNGGIGAGIEWVFVIGCASALGAWLWQIEFADIFGFVSILEFGIFSGITGGMVGWFTWFFFRDKREKNKLTGAMLVGYLFAFTYIAVVNPILAQLMFMVAMV